MTDEQVIKRFHGLYAGASAQKLRDAGQETAMPPWAETYWLGRQVVKCPLDLWTYQEIIFETQPTLIIETGTSGGGSAYFFATLFDLMHSDGLVVTIDEIAYPDIRPEHDSIIYLVGDSTGPVMFDWLTNWAPKRKTMVCLDALHTYEHVKKELELYAPLVSPGCYLVVEDTGWRDPKDTPEGEWADRAVEEFLVSHPEFQVDLSREKHLLTSNHGGWLRRVE